MIVVSGALVVLSIILLVTGLTTRDDLDLIYVSIGSSVLAGVFLILGALQRREDKPAASGAAAREAASPYERVTTVSVTSPREASAASSGPVTGNVVSVVPGRPRFHTSDCRFLAGRPDVETVALDDATAQGYTECGVCKPTESLAASSSARGGRVTEDEVAAQAFSAADDELAEPAAPVRRTASRTSKPAAKPARSGAAAKPAPASASRGTRAPAKAAAKPAARTTRAAAAPARAAKPAAKATKAAAKAAPGTVVVIPDRDKFHTADCRFVRDVAGTLTVAKASARRQGYAPCGVCKP